ncbi:MAG: DUF721 domain-containing protein [Bacteroidota bacterium]
MSSSSPQSLGAVLQSVIDRMGARQRIDEVRAVEQWAHLAGPTVNGVTSKVWVREGVLFVHLTSAMWRHQLHLQRERWRERLNQQLGREVIREIVFR